MSASDDKTIVVVVVEDEALIRMVVTHALIDEGFEVLEAEHAADALTHFAVDPERIHALFTDIHMPGNMDGMKLAHHAKFHWPWVSLLLTSGRARPAAQELPKLSRFIAKPYDLLHVVSHIREMRAAA